VSRGRPSAGPALGKLPAATVVAGSFLIAAAVIRGAAAWTTQLGPLPTHPPGVAVLEAELASEHARAEALQTALDDLVAGSKELGAALDAAGARLDERLGAAQGLRSELSAARARLEGLQRALAAAGRR
jgi:hypothetical protein